MKLHSCRGQAACAAIFDFVPTLFSHPVVPLALRFGAGRERISNRLLVAGALGSILPDLDVIGFWYGIPHESEFGHRGFTHSIMFAVVTAAISAIAYPLLKTTFLKAFVFLLLSVASHGVLDAFTDGGAGIALLWPWSENRYFAPFRPIKVAPIGIADFVANGGLAVLLSELVWLWLPCVLGYVALTAERKRTAAYE